MHRFFHAKTLSRGDELRMSRKLTIVGLFNESNLTNFRLHLPRPLRKQDVYCIRPESIRLPNTIIPNVPQIVRFRSMTLTKNKLNGSHTVFRSGIG